MKRNRKSFGVLNEIAVGREDGKLTAPSDRANQEIYMRTLDALAAATIIKLGSGFVVLRNDWNVGKRGEFSSKQIEWSGFGDT
jgi:hypothetical protein